MVLILALVLVGIGAWLALNRVPEFYQQVLVPSEAGLGDELERRALEVRNEIQRAENWELEITQDQINSWLAVDLPRKFPALLPPEIDAPRAAITQQSLLLGCGYDAGTWKGVLSLECEPYLTTTPNEIAFRIVRARAGKVPLPLPRLLNPIATAALKSGWNLRWDEKQGAPVALVRFSDRHSELGPHRILLESLELGSGKLVLRGRSIPERADEANLPGG